MLLNACDPVVLGAVGLCVGAPQSAAAKHCNGRSDSGCLPVLKTLQMCFLHARVRHGRQLPRLRLLSEGQLYVPFYPCSPFWMGRVWLSLGTIVASSPTYEQRNFHAARPRKCQEKPKFRPLEASFLPGPVFDQRSRGPGYHSAALKDCLSEFLDGYFSSACARRATNNSAEQTRHLM